MARTACLRKWSAISASVWYFVSEFQVARCWANSLSVCSGYPRRVPQCECTSISFMSTSLLGARRLAHLREDHPGNPCWQECPSYRWTSQEARLSALRMGPNLAATHRDAGAWLINQVQLAQHSPLRSCAPIN